MESESLQENETLSEQDHVDPVGRAGRPLSLVYFLNLLLRWRHAILTGMLLAFVAGAAITSLEPPAYVTSSILMPEGGGSSSIQAALARQSPIPISFSSNPEGEFYLLLLRTRGFLDEIARREYAVVLEGDTVEAMIPYFFDREPPSEELAVRSAVNLLRSEILDVSLDQATGAVLVEVTTLHPDLSVQIHEALLEGIEDFNLERRRSRAREERRFVEQQMLEAAEELRRAEEDLERFLEQNRAIESSPRLVFVRGRLQRELSLRQDLYTQLANAFQQARIEEVRGTRLITVVEHPVDTLRRKGSIHWLVAGAVAAFLVALGIFVIALLVDYLRREQDEMPEDYQQLRELWQISTAKSGKAISWIGPKHRRD